MGKELKVIHVTTHVSLRRVPDLVTRDRVLRTIRLAQRTLQGLGQPHGRIAVAGLNPHAGEDGLFGDEEGREIIPAIEAARAEGLDVTGPLPADTLFSRARGGEFDIVVAMYHDQGHIPVKTLGFEYDEATQEMDGPLGRQRHGGAAVPARVGRSRHGVRPRVEGHRQSRVDGRGTATLAATMLQRGLRRAMDEPTIRSLIRRRQGRASDPPRASCRSWSGSA